MGGLKNDLDNELKPRLSKQGRPNKEDNPDKTPDEDEDAAAKALDDLDKLAGSSDSSDHTHQGLSEAERKKILDSHEDDINRVKDELARSKKEISDAKARFHKAETRRIKHAMVEAAQRSVIEAKRHAAKLAEKAG